MALQKAQKPTSTFKKNSPTDSASESSMDYHKMLQLQRKALIRNSSSVQLKEEQSALSENLSNDKKYTDDNSTGFDTEEAAAEDFGRKYNAKSIEEKVEYGSSIFYRLTESGQKKYFYSEPRVGRAQFVRPSKPKNKIDRQHIVAFVHTHGEYKADRDWSKHIGRDKSSKVDWNNTFSYSYDGSKKNEGDIEYFQKNKVNGYLIGPNGKMVKFDFLENEEKDPKPEIPITHQIPTKGIPKDPNNQ